MQVTTVSFFRFDGFWNQFWAFRHMGFARRPLRCLPGLEFFKLLGIGRRRGFHPAPNWGAYCILATWSSLDAARENIESSRIFDGYRSHATEDWTLYLSTVRSRGRWDQRQPFTPYGHCLVEPPVGILTRASISWWRARSFWSSVPAVSDMCLEQSAVRFTIGMGEWPVSHLTTFSVWEDFESLKNFAYTDGHHRRVMLRARREKWFEEELFVRFRILGTRGSWHGANPLNGLRLADS